MKRFQARFLALCGLVVLTAAAAAPFVAGAQSCPSVRVNCGGKIRTCTGTVNGDRCEYSNSCLTCGGSGFDGGGISPIEMIQE